jgi:hypothetical protein
MFMPGVEVTAKFHWDGHLVEVFGLFDGETFEHTDLKITKFEPGPVGGVLLGERVAQTIEKVTGKKAKGCGGCGKRKAMLNNWDAKRKLKKAEKERKRKMK